MSQKAKSPSDIRFESKIVWLEDIRNIPYVREHFETSPDKKTGELKYGGHQVIGYAELEDKAPKSTGRRVFWLAKYDRLHDPNGAYKVGCPMEAVDPQTVTEKVIGTKTERAWNGKLPPDVY